MNPPPHTLRTPRTPFPRTPATLATLALLPLLLLSRAPAQNPDPHPLPGTAPLTLTGDIASNLVAGVDRFLIRKLDESVTHRAALWNRDLSSPQAHAASVQTNRQRLAHILGVRDPRPPKPRLEWVSTPDTPARIGTNVAFEAHEVRWTAFGDVHGEGLLLSPLGRTPIAQVVAVPDATQTPEQLAGLADGIPPEAQFARRLAEAGCRVLVPTIIDRNHGPHKGRARLTAREFVYRSAFELGRHILGYEVQKILAGVDWFAAQPAPSGAIPIGVFGWGEGGQLALHAAALDTRIASVGVSGYIDDRRQIWREPIDRNVFGLLEQFGDAEILSLIAPRAVVVEACRAPEIIVTGVGGGAPGRLTTPALETVRREVQRAEDLLKGLNPAPPITLVASGPDGTGPFGTEPALGRFLAGLGITPPPTLPPVGSAPRPDRPLPDPAARQARQLHELDRHNQQLLVESPLVRQEFMKHLDTSSPERFAATVEPYRAHFHNEVIGRFPDPLLPPQPRTRKAYDKPGWTGHEVVLDVFPDVIAYGILLVPKGIEAGERRPVVVCQHGLEGRPQDIITGDHEAYHDFAAKLAERGFVTFSPQNLYIFTDRFRSLQRKSYPLGKTLFSTIVPQHQQIVDWLETLPFVDPRRIAFYGLSYGGKSAMRIPPLVPEYVLSICSADFNDWVAKNAATSGTIGRYSYVWTGEYEIFEWDLGSTFNYAEMAALIAPRPFMVERGHFDGVAPDETVAYEFAKVRFLYAARLGIGDRCEMETFVGPHTIHGQGTFEFLHKHLAWPRP